MRKIQKRIVDGKTVVFQYTSEMKQVVIDNCTKSYEEICALLKDQWPYWEFKPLCVKDIIRRQGLNIPKRPAQKRIVGDKIEYFEFTPEMEEIVKANYATKSNQEICDMLKALWPYWNFNQFSMRGLTKRLELRRTPEQTHAIIIRECASEAGKKRFEKLSSLLTKYKIGDMFFCRRDPYYGRLVVKVSKKKVKYYERYLYEKHFGEVTRDCTVELIDPFGPIVPENLTLIRHNFKHLSENSINLKDNFVIGTLTRDKLTPEEKQEFMNSPGVEMLIEAKRTYIKLLRAIKEYENAGSATNTTDNKVEGTP